jgi:hypothetical protein
MLGFHTTNGGKGAKQAVTQVIDQSGGADTAAATWLAAYFGVSVTIQPPPTPVPAVTGTGLPSATPAPTVGGVIVVLGSNEEQAFLGDPGFGN